MKGYARNLIERFRRSGCLGGCGVKSFYVPRSNPDGYDVNVRCLDPAPENITIEAFDGKNWEEHAHEFRHLSEET